ncbi:MAG: hypothetical protein WC306_01675 [Candidatus Paceibacterota bacterium]|jgi:hypothetical protein
MNEVDRLKALIAEIQGNCDHDWRVIKEAELIESLVPGVFVGSRGPFGTAARMKLFCTRCSQRIQTSIILRCPHCLSPMRKGDLYTMEDGGKTSREKYFGVDEPYYAIRIHCCTLCSFMTASDEWNQ